MDPWFLTGFVDGEGCFSVIVIRSNKLKTGWVVHPKFSISLHQKDKALLEQIQSYFCGAGSIIKQGPLSIQFQIQSVKDLKVIIDHFERYPLITQKRADYELFKQVFEIISNKKHLTTEGLEKLVAIKASMNKGLSVRSELKAAFPKILPVPRPSIVNQQIKDPQWVAGFTSGEGCFYINIMNSASHSLGFQVQLIFKLTQHERDEELMRSLVDYLDCCGNVYIYKEAVDYIVIKFTDLTEKILPFFEKYPLFGVKSKDFEDFKQVVKLMQNKAHLTEEGLNQIRQIKAGMNKGRPLSDGNTRGG